MALLKDSLFQNLDYEDYLINYPIHEFFNIDLNVYGKIEKKTPSLYEGVDSENITLTKVPDFPK